MQALRRTYAVLEGRSPPGGDDVLIALGDDDDGVALEVGVVIDDDGELVVVHAVELRDTYRAADEAGRQGAQ